MHGRGGQGVVTFANLLSVAAFRDGLESQMIPSFGPERTGAPIAASVRISDRPIRTREPVASPDAVVVLDASLLGLVPALDGLRPDGWLLVNSGRPPDELPLSGWSPADDGRLVVLDAPAVCADTLGQRTVNTCLLGAFAAQTGAVTLTSVDDTIAARFHGATATVNLRAAHAGFGHVRREVRTGA